MLKITITILDFLNNAKFTVLQQIYDCPSARSYCILIGSAQGIKTLSILEYQFKISLIKYMSLKDLQMCLLVQRMSRSDPNFS